MQRERFCFLGIAAAAIGLLCTYSFWPEGRVWLHAALVQVSHGVSGGKIGFLLVYVAIAAGMLAIWPLKNQMPSVEVSRRTRRADIWSWVWWVSIGVGGAASVASCVIYMQRFGLPLDAHSHHWRGGVNSFNTLTHVHTSKAIIARVIDLAGAGHLHSYFDTGLAYVAAVPAQLAWITGVSFVVALVSGLVHIRRVVERHAPGHRVAVGVVAMLAASSLAKCILDGGPLAYDAVVAIGALVLLGRAGAVEELPRVFRAIRPQMLYGAALWIGVMALVDGFALQSQLVRGLGRIAVYGLILATPMFASRLRTESFGAKAGWAAAWGLCAMVVGFNLILEVFSALPLKLTAPAEIVSYRDGRPRLLSLLHGADCPDCAAAYRHLGDNPLRVRSTSMVSPRPGVQTGLVAKLIVVDGPAVPVVYPTKALRLRSVELPAEHTTGPLTVEFAFDDRLGPVVAGIGVRNDQILQNDRFAALYLVDQALRDAGVREYILIPQGYFALKQEVGRAEARQFRDRSRSGNKPLNQQSQAPTTGE